MCSGVRFLDLLAKLSDSELVKMTYNHCLLAMVSTKSLSLGPPPPPPPVNCACLLPEKKVLVYSWEPPGQFRTILANMLIIDVSGCQEQMFYTFQSFTRYIYSVKFNVTTIIIMTFTRYIGSWAQWRSGCEFMKKLFWSPNHCTMR